MAKIDTLEEYSYEWDEYVFADAHMPRLAEYVEAELMEYNPASPLHVDDLIFSTFWE